MFANVFRGSKNITYKPVPRPIKRTVRANYVERELDTEFECAECAIRFQVYGIFGYCPGCSCENLQIYDANWTCPFGRREKTVRPMPDWAGGQLAFGRRTVLSGVDTATRWRGEAGPVRRW